LLVKPCLDSEQHRLTSNRWHPDRRRFLVLHPRPLTASLGLDTRRASR
jgi:hypothetical protein